MMEEKFKYRYDRTTRIATGLYIVLIAVALVTISLFAESNYFRAWFFVIFGAVLALYLLSIPRFVRVGQDAVEIHCTVEMTRILMEDVAHIRRIDRDDYGRLIVTLGSFGFFGYYGYFYSTRYWESVKVYATELSNLVEIEDIYEQKYIISCREADKLIQTVNRLRGRPAAKE